MDQWKNPSRKQWNHPSYPHRDGVDDLRDQLARLKRENPNLYRQIVGVVKAINELKSPD